jgi:hypothetical protein
MVAIEEKAQAGYARWAKEKQQSEAAPKRRSRKGPKWHFVS